MNQWDFFEETNLEPICAACRKRLGECALYWHDAEDRDICRVEVGPQLEKLRAQRLELTEFDRRPHHYALQRISLDLDDGVKVNYGKFSDPTIGDILANVKDITGGKDE